MDYIYKSWVIQIDITNVCKKHCIYCTRHLGHVSSQKRYSMNLDRFEEIIKSLEGWPNVVGIMGGEPLLHPQFKDFVTLAAKYIPKDRLQLWTSGLPGTPWENPRLVPEIANKFGHIHYNPHDTTQLSVCRHQPLTIAIDEAVPDKGMMWKLINDCWLPRLWAPSVVEAGGYFCEVAGPLDALLFGGKHAWKIEPGWWKRPPESFQEQISELCTRCGMCLPMERQHLEETTEKFSPKLAKDFREAGAIRLDEKNIEIFDEQFSSAEIIKTARNWYPTNYRDDLKADETLPEWEKGVLVNLEPNANAKNIFRLDTEEEFSIALDGIKKLAPDEIPVEFSFVYKGWPFNPLREPYPFVLNNHKKENLLYFRAMLLHFRQILDDVDFFELAKKNITQELLQELAHNYRTRLQKRYISRAKDLGKSYHGRKVYFWGHGAAWRYYAPFFESADPQCFLVDQTDYVVHNAINGIPILSPDDLMKEGAPALPSIMCVRESFAGWSKIITEKYSSLIDGKLQILLLGQTELL